MVNLTRKPAFKKLEAVITKAEQGHRGEIVVFVQAREPFFSNATPRKQAIDIFARHRVWATPEHTGVLLFFHLSKHAIEIVVDSGVEEKVDKKVWSKICSEVAERLKQGAHIEDGIELAILRTGEELKKVFPGQKTNNELTNSISEV